MRLNDVFVPFITIYSATMRMVFKGVHAVFYITGKTPMVRNVFPWTNPKHSNLSMIPINKDIHGYNEILPPQVVHEIIDNTSHYVIYNKCSCRVAFKCENHTHDIGCLFIGEDAEKMPSALTRRVTREEAHEHVDKAIAGGLVPTIGKFRVDNFLFMIPDRKKLMSICFCCHCCCMVTYTKHMPSKQLDQIIVPIEGLSLEVTDKCNGCGECVDYCAFNAVDIIDGMAVHNDYCRICGRCQSNCPNGAINISMDNENFMEDTIKHMREYVDFS